MEAEGGNVPAFIHKLVMRIPKEYLLLADSQVTYCDNVFQDGEGQSKGSLFIMIDNKTHSKHLSLAL